MAAFSLRRTYKVDGVRKSPSRPRFALVCRLSLSLPSYLGRSSPISLSLSLWLLASVPFAGSERRSHEQYSLRTDIMHQSVKSFFLKTQTFVFWLRRTCRVTVGAPSRRGLRVQQRLAHIVPPSRTHELAAPCRLKGADFCGQNECNGQVERPCCGV